MKDIITEMKAIDANYFVTNADKSSAEKVLESFNYFVANVDADEVWEEAFVTSHSKEEAIQVIAEDLIGQLIYDGEIWTLTSNECERLALQLFLHYKNNVIEVDREDVQLVSDIECFGNWISESIKFTPHESCDIHEFNGKIYKIWKDSIRLGGF